MTSIMGIDPGKEGAVAIFPLREKEFVVLNGLLQNIDYCFFRAYVHDFAVSHIYLEKAQSMPKQGVTGMFHYGQGFGRLIGWIESLMIPFTLVTPQQWMKIMHQGATGKDAKAKSLQVAQRLFPELDFKATERCKKPHMGLVDACLIAEYGRRTYK